MTASLCSDAQWKNIFLKQYDCSLNVTETYRRLRNQLNIVTDSIFLHLGENQQSKHFGLSKNSHLCNENYYQFILDIAG